MSNIEVARTGRIILIHGIETAGVQSVDRVGRLLSDLGYHVEDVQLQPTRWWQGRSLSIRNENLERIRAVAQPGDHVVAHSNGCRLCWDLIDGGTEFGHLFWFAPALDRGLTLRDCKHRHLDVFANPYDKALLAGSLIPGRHPWGAMGRKGYQGRCGGKARTLWFPERRGLGHGHYFESPLLEQIVDIIDQELTLGVTKGGA